jgi:hypothetical protein
VREVNQAPRLAPLAEQSVVEGATAVFIPAAYDPDLPAQRLGFSVDPPMPDGVTVDPGTGEIVWETGFESGPATAELTLRVTDDGAPALSASQPVRLVIQAVPHLVINEVLFRPAVADAEFIEIHNPSTTRTESLRGLRLSGESLQFQFADGATLGPGRFVCVVKRGTAFAAAYPNGAPVAGEFNGTLGRDHDRLRLAFEPSGGTGEPVGVDRMEYFTQLPWPLAATTAGVSLQRVDARQDGTRPGNWAAVAGLPPGQSRQLVTLTNVWRYQQNGQDLGVAWRQPGFNDAAWPQGGGLLYVESAALPAPKTTLLTLGPMTFYFRTEFTYAGPTLGVALQLSTVIDDGAVFYLNGRRLYGLAMPEDPFDAATPAQRTVGDAVLEGPFTVPATDLRVGRNVLAAEVHQISSGSSDVVMGAALELDGANVPASTPGAANSVAAALTPFPALWINEVAPAGGGRVDGAGEADPWIELYNAGPRSRSLDGCSLSPDPAQLEAWTFPSGVVIPPHSTLLVWADGEAGETRPGEWHAGFRLPAGTGQVVLSLREAGQPRVLDHLAYAEVPAGLSRGSLPDGQRWSRMVFNPPTPNAANGAVPAAPRIQSWGWNPDGSLSLTWSAQSGRSYELEATAAPAGGAWQVVGRVLATGDTATLSDTAAAGSAERYYRVRVLP